MKKTYLIIPLLALLVLGGLNYNHQLEAKRHVQARELRLKQEKELRIKTETEAREKALAAALLEQDKRKQARAQAEERESARKEARLALTQARDQARRELDKRTRQMERLRNEIAAEEGAGEKAQERLKMYKTQQQFLETHLALSRSNLRQLQNVLGKIMPVETPPTGTPTAAYNQKP